MAVIQYTAIVNQIRGKLNGSVFNKAKTVNTLQRKQQQPKGSRGFQSEIRSVFSRWQRTWKSLSIVVQTGWGVTASNNPTRDRFGNLVNLSGYNQYLKASILNEYGGGAPLTSAYGMPAPANALLSDDPYDNAFTSYSGGTRVTSIFNIFQEVYSPDFIYIIDFGLPMSSGVTNYHGRFVHVTGASAIDSSDTSVTVDLGRNYPMPISGQPFMWRLRLIHRLSGAVVSTVLVRAFAQVV